MSTGEGMGESACTLREDATNLHSAFQGAGCDIGRIVNILGRSNSVHRSKIQEEYRDIYQEDLIERISSELSGFGVGDIKETVGVDVAPSPTGALSSIFSSNIKRALALWMLEEGKREATIVNNGLAVVSADLAAVTEVLCSRTPSQLANLQQAYYSKFGSELSEDISAFTSIAFGSHKELLLACLRKERDEGAEVDLNRAEMDAKKLYEDGEKRWGTRDKTFIDILTLRNRPHLVAVEAAYRQFYHHSLEKAIKKETSGYLRDGLLILIKCAKNPAKYFAKVLYKSLKDLGTSDTTLIRVVVTRAEIDMQEIKDEYEKTYKKTLKEAIHSDTSGDYRTFLLDVVDSKPSTCSCCSIV